MNEEIKNLKHRIDRINSEIKKTKCSHRAKRFSLKTEHKKELASMRTDLKQAKQELRKKAAQLLLEKTKQRSFSWLKSLRQNLSNYREERKKNKELKAVNPEVYKAMRILDDIEAHLEVYEKRVNEKKKELTDRNKKFLGKCYIACASMIDEEKSELVISRARILRGRLSNLLPDGNKLEQVEDMMEKVMKAMMENDKEGMMEQFNQLNAQVIKLNPDQAS